MNNIAAHCCAARLGLAMLLALGASGCPKGAVPPPGPAGKPRHTHSQPVNCDQTITVDPHNFGAYPPQVYICIDDTVTFDPNGHTFKAEFKTGTPFQGGQTVFDNDHLTGTVKHHYDQLEIYKYTITIDKTTVFDPQVVGGGNP